MSAETVSWKTGACHASVSRRAIVLRVEVERDLLDLAGRGQRRGGSSGRRRESGLLDVLRDDPALRARSR